MSFALSSVQLVRGWTWTWRKADDEALKPQPKSSPKGSATPKVLTEEDKLRRQVAQLETENAYLKKLRDLRTQGWVVNHKLVYKLMRQMGLQAQLRFTAAPYC